MDRGKPLKIGVCAKKSLVADSLASLLENDGGFDVVAKESSPVSLIESAKVSQATVMVVDATDLDLGEFQYLLGARAFGNFRIVMLVSEGESLGFPVEAVDKLIYREAGANGLFESILEFPDLTQKKFTTFRETRRIYGNGSDLTSREIEVARLVAKGHSNRTVSTVTGLQEQSVKNLVSNVMRKLNCVNRVQVALSLAQLGEVRPNE
jgi:DNA-binding NarL/FixJ family response regulator